MSDNYMLSTEGNPWNPFTEFDKWRQWDEQEGYHSNALIGRVLQTLGASDELPQPMQEEMYDKAVNQIVSDNFSGVHIKVAEPS